MAKNRNKVDKTSNLTPAQATAFEKLQEQLDAFGAAILMARPGMGKTQILRALHAKMGGAYLTSKEFIEASSKRDPLALDETIYGVLDAALDAHDVVIADDFQLVSYVACCVHAYPRQNFLGAAMVPLANRARDDGKKLVLTAEGLPVPSSPATFPTISSNATSNPTSTAVLFIVRPRVEGWLRRAPDLRDTSSDGLRLGNRSGSQ